MKSSQIKALDARMDQAGAVQAALNARIDPRSLGFKDIFTIDNGDPLIGSDDQMAVNDLAAGNRLRAPLQSLVQSAAMNDDLRPEIDFLAPRVDVTGQNGYFSYTDMSGGISTLTSISQLERAVNGTVGLIDGVGAEVPGFCKSYGLGSEIDEDRCPNVQLEMETRIMEIMELISLFRLQQRVAALTAIAHNTGANWNSISNPDGDARAAIEAARVGSGIRPTRAYYGQTAWNARQSAYERQATAGAFQGTMREPEGLAAYLGLSGALVSKALQKDNAGALSSVYGNNVLFFRNNANASRRSNDILKTFSCDDNGQQFRTHQRQVSEKVWRVAVTYRELLLVTGPVTGNPVQQLTITATEPEPS